MSEHRWSRLRCSPPRLTTASVFGSIDCSLQFHSASSTTPPRRYGCRSVPPRHLRSVAVRGAPLHLRLQTIFDGYVPAFAATPPLSGCRPAPLHCQPETFACFSDSQGQASALRPPVGALPPSATILPPIRGLMNAQSLARGTRFICRRGQVCRRLRLSTPPGTWLLQWHLTAHFLSRSHPQSSPTPSIFGRGSVALRFG